MTLTLWHETKHDVPVGAFVAARIDDVAEAVVSLLERDRELGEDLDPVRLAAALELARAPVLTLPRGSWEQPRWSKRVQEGAGLLLLDGLILRRVGIEGRYGAELLSAGDLLRPWQSEEATSSLSHDPRWNVLTRCKIAVIDVDLMRRLADYPEIHGQLVARAIRRVRRLAVNIAIVHQPKVESRLRMLLWHLADRCGTVRPDGVIVPVRLTHETLAELTAARRPTVSAAVGTLERLGALRRTSEGWLLRGAPPSELQDSLGRALSASGNRR